MLFQNRRSVFGKIILVFIAVLLGITASLYAQPPVTTGDDIPAIEVTGTAETEIVPDEIYVDIVLQERYEGKEKLTLDMQEDQLKMALATIGIDLKDLNLSRANASYVRVKWKKKDVLSRKNYQLKLPDAASVGRLFEQLDKLDIDNAHIVRMDHSKMDSIKKEMRIKAIKAGKEKAEYLLAAVGHKPGKPLLVQEREYNEIVPLTANVMNREYQQEDVYKSAVLSFGRDIQIKMIKVQASVFVRFQIQ